MRTFLRPKRLPGTTLFSSRMFPDALDGMDVDDTREGEVWLPEDCSMALSHDPMSRAL